MSEGQKQPGRVPQWMVNCMRVRDFFVASGDKQEVFARRMNVTQPALNHWLHMRFSPTTDHQEKMAEKLGVPMKCMVCRDDDSVCKSCNLKRRPPRQHPSA